MADSRQTAPTAEANRVRAAGVAVRAEDLSKRYGEGGTAVDALRDVDVEFAAGSFTAIMGPSGSGKSTLLHILAGLEQPTSGWVEIAGTRLDGLSERELALLRRGEIGFIFQSYNLLPVLTAEENMTLPVTIGGGDIDHEWLERLIETTGLGDRRGHRPSELSGGEQQRVAVARALAGGNPILLADEPTGELDFRTGVQILELLHAQAHTGRAVLIVTHNREIARVADRVIELSSGRVVRDGPPEGGQVDIASLRW